MSSHDGILSSHLSYFISSIRWSAYVDNFSSVRTKKLPDVQGHISHGYISLLSADWASLKWRAATVYRISNFMAAYGRLLTRDTTDQQLTWSPCAWKSVVIRWAAVLTSASVTKINRRGHCQMQYSETRPAPQQCDCMRQWTCYNSTVLEKLRWPTAQTDACTCDDRGHWRRSTHDSILDFKGSYGSLSQQCPVRHPASRVGQSHTLRRSQHEVHCRPNSLTSLRVTQFCASYAQKIL